MDNTHRRLQKKRLLRSCNECRGSKLRCAPDDDIDDRCQRCTRLQLVCVFSEARQRARKSVGERSIRGEKNINENLTDIPLFDPIFQPQDSAFLQNALVDTGFHLDLKWSLTPEKQHPGQQPSGEQASEGPDIIYNGLISAVEADLFLQAFRLEHREIPFVILPPIPLRCYKLHDTLALELRKAIASRLIIDGVKTLDLLQCLLVYLSWFHLNASQAAQLYVLVQMTLSIAIELVEAADPCLELSRAFIGAYILSSSTSIMLQKPFSTKFNNYVERSCRLLEASNESTDMMALSAVKVLQVAENIASLFDYSLGGRDTLAAESIELSVEAFRSQLQNLQRTGLFRDYSPSILMSIYDAAWMTLYGVSLYMNEVVDRPCLFEGNSTQSCTIRTRLLLNCLEVTKRYLDRYLRLPLVVIKRYTCIEKMQLAHAIVVLIKLSFCTHTNLGLRFRQACKVPYYLGAIAEYAGKISSTPVDGDHHDSFRVFERLMTHLSAWYERLDPIELEKGSRLIALSPMQIIKLSEEDALVNFNFNDLGSMLDGVARRE